MLRMISLSCLVSLMPPAGSPLADKFVTENSYPCNTLLGDPGLEDYTAIVYMSLAAIGCNWASTPNCCSTGCLPDPETDCESEESESGDASAAESVGPPLLASPRVTGGRLSLCWRVALKAQKLQPIPLPAEEEASSIDSPSRICMTSVTSANG